MRYLSEDPGEFDMQDDPAAGDNIGDEPPFWASSQMAGLSGLGQPSAACDAARRRLLVVQEKIRNVLPLVNRPSQPGRGWEYADYLKTLRTHEKLLQQRINRTCGRHMVMAGMGQWEPIVGAALNPIASILGLFIKSPAQQQAEKAAKQQMQILKAQKEMAQWQAQQSQLDQAKKDQRIKMLIWGGVAVVGIGGLALLAYRSRRK